MKDYLIIFIGISFICTNLATIINSLNIEKLNQKLERVEK